VQMNRVQEPVSPLSFLKHFLRAKPSTNFRVEDLHVNCCVGFLIFMCTNDFTEIMTDDYIIEIYVQSICNSLDLVK